MPFLNLLAVIGGEVTKNSFTLQEEMENILLQIDSYNLEPLLAHFYTLFSQFQQMALHESQQSISCKSGCATCCNHWVEDVYSFEVERIVSYLRTFLPQQISTIIDESKRSEGVFETLYNTHSFSEDDDEELLLLTSFFKEEIACPLLDSEGDCLVYPVRPLTCRSFFSKRDPIFCKSEYLEEIEEATFLLTPSEEVQDLLDILHEKYDRFGITGLRALLWRVLEKKDS